MGRKKKDNIQFRYYDLPQKEHCLALLGPSWVRRYGEGIDYLHFHNLLEIGYCRQGTGILTLNDRCLPYEPGMISVIPRNYPHNTDSEEGTQSFWEYLFLDPEELLRSLYPENEHYCQHMLSLINRDAVLGKQNQYPQLTAVALAAMEEMRHKREFYVEAVEGLLRVLLFEIARIAGRQPDEGDSCPCSGRMCGMTVIHPALEYIQTEYAEPVRVEKLAGLCSMSETHFRRLFVEYMGMTPVDYINAVRIRMACERMKRSDEAMNDIAVRCGFLTVSTFNRNFKKFIGVTPYQWKKDPANFESTLLKFHISAEKGW
ncbi:AraC family transcriptional regulator [Lachnoclostridium sp. Marseille-P6806]|uniref:AraC family transcriptional regulator n=1 Tax=Lachnoclostridium sp. Marseille-P6806 TaxID=2364793 RepID=UPI0010317EAA|nr:AraC family transcriptional regulator [Lachnoclostridium sp. Marseille-P6806]